ncbi:hypothetical protein IHE44_0000716 [Lamprotornis superbus]|uniref:Uncharacterized protein n=1 Tax=Lamprotornis superbus TaxID=245042 RepID=A0A835NY99_9PASS|nr:hypothetical protein IHE44_0000716 [Lamprotornis superbus]
MGSDPGSTGFHVTKSRKILKLAKLNRLKCESHGKLTECFLCKFNLSLRTKAFHCLYVVLGLEGCNILLEPAGERYDMQLKMTAEKTPTLRVGTETAKHKQVKNANKDQSRYHPFPFLEPKGSDCQHIQCPLAVQWYRAGCTATATPAHVKKYVQCAAENPLFDQKGRSPKQKQKLLLAGLMLLRQLLSSLGDDDGGLIMAEGCIGFIRISPRIKAHNTAGPFELGMDQLHHKISSFRQHICSPCPQHNAIYRSLLMPADSAHPYEFHAALQQKRQLLPFLGVNMRYWKEHPPPNSGRAYKGSQQSFFPISVQAIAKKPNHLGGSYIFYFENHLSCFTIHILHRSKGFKKNIEFDLVYFADAETEAIAKKEGAFLGPPSLKNSPFSHFLVQKLTILPYLTLPAYKSTERGRKIFNGMDFKVYLMEGTARDRILGNQGKTQLGRSTAMSQVQGQARKHHEGWSLVWWSPQPELWGDGDQPCWGITGTGADGSGGWHGVLRCGKCGKPQRVGRDDQTWWCPLGYDSSGGHVGMAKAKGSLLDPDLNQERLRTAAQSKENRNGVRAGTQVQSPSEKEDWKQGWRQSCLQSVLKSIQQIQSISQDSKRENQDHNHDQDPGPHKAILGTLSSLHESEKRKKRKLYQAKLEKERVNLRSGFQEEKRQFITLSMKTKSVSMLTCLVYSDESASSSQFTNFQAVMESCQSLGLTNAAQLTDIHTLEHHGLFRKKRKVRAVIDLCNNPITANSEDFPPLELPLPPTWSSLPDSSCIQSSHKDCTHISFSMLQLNTPPVGDGYDDKELKDCHNPSSFPSFNHHKSFPPLLCFASPHQQLFQSPKLPEPADFMTNLYKYKNTSDLTCLSKQQDFTQAKCVVHHLIRDGISGFPHLSTLHFPFMPEFPRGHDGNQNLRFGEYGLLPIISYQQQLPLVSPYRAVIPENDNGSDGSIPRGWLLPQGGSTASPDNLLSSKPSLFSRRLEQLCPRRKEEQDLIALAQTLWAESNASLPNPNTEQKEDFDTLVECIYSSSDTKDVLRSRGSSRLLLLGCLFSVLLWLYFCIDNGLRLLRFCFLGFFLGHCFLLLPFFFFCLIGSDLSILFSLLLLVVLLHFCGLCGFLGILSLLWSLLFLSCCSFSLLVFVFSFLIIDTVSLLLLAQFASHGCGHPHPAAPEAGTAPTHRVPPSFAASSGIARPTPCIPTLSTMADTEPEAQQDCGHSIRQKKQRQHRLSYAIKESNYYKNGLALTVPHRAASRAAGKDRHTDCTSCYLCLTARAKLPELLLDCMQSVGNSVHRQKNQFGSTTGTCRNSTACSAGQARAFGQVTGKQYHRDPQQPGLSDRAIFMVLLFLPKATNILEQSALQHIFPTPPRGTASERGKFHNRRRHTTHQPGTAEMMQEVRSCSEAPSGTGSHKSLQRQGTLPGFNTSYTRLKDGPSKERYVSEFWTRVGKEER